MPTGWQPGDLLVLVVSSKAATPPTLTTPSGWTAPSSNTVTGGTGTAGADAGPLRVTMVYREAQAGDTAPTIDISAAASPTMAVILAFSKGLSDIWAAPVCTTASDTTGSTTTYGTVTGASTIDLASGDMLCAVDGINGDIGTWSSPQGTLTVTGCTLSGTTVLVNQGTTSGNDGRLTGAYVTYTSGTASAGPARSITYTSGGASTSGATVFWRLRVSTSSVSGSVTSTTTAGATVTGVVGKVGSVLVFVFVITAMSNGAVTFVAA